MEVILNNPTEMDIIDYPISEYQCDPKGNPIIDRDTQRPMETGLTYTWSLKAGEKKRFPKYVADVLKERYEFLESGDPLEKEEEAPIPEDEEPLNEGEVRCKYCRKVFTSARALGMHLGAAHADKII